MREYAIVRQDRLGISNVELRDGVAEDLSAFADDEFDRAIVSTTPGWHMDHERPRRHDEPAPPNFLAEHLGPFGFGAHDAVVTMDYGSLDESLATWGFIYGDAAIDHLLDHGTSRLTWGLRVWHRQV